MEKCTSTVIRMPDKVLSFFVIDKKSDNVTNVPVFTYFGFLNNLNPAKGFNIEAAGKMENRNMSRTFL